MESVQAHSAGQGQGPEGQKTMRSYLTGRDTPATAGGGEAGGPGGEEGSKGLLSGLFRKRGVAKEEVVEESSYRPPSSRARDEGSQG
jgi:hypothetical protein